MTYQPSDEQIDALARYQNGLLETTAVFTEELEGATDLVDSPAFQAIIRAAQAEAWQAAILHLWTLNDPGHTVENVTSRNVIIGTDVTQALHENPYMESADV